MSQKLSQKRYSISFELGKPNKQGECLIYLRHFAGKKSLHPTPFRVLPGQFNKDKNKKDPVQKHPNASDINTELNNIRIAFERDLITGKLDNAATSLGNGLIVDYIIILRRQLDGRLSDGTLRHYVVIQNKLEAFDKDARFSDVSIDWMRRVEAAWRKDIGQNTINSNMKKLKAVLSKAVDAGLLSRDQYANYKSPPYIQNIPSYLTEDEIEHFKKVVETIGNPAIQKSGYFFLLGCYTGYRISDWLAFDYEKMVREEDIIIRAKKNKQIVSIGIYPKLQEILDVCRHLVLNTAEPVIRKHVKEIARMAGIKHDVKPHSARHSFAMMLMKKGFTVDEVADMLGDSPQVARIYARISNTQLKERAKRLLG